MYRNVSDTHQCRCDLGSKQTPNREGYEDGFKVFGRGGQEGKGYSCPIEEPRARCWREGLSAPSTLTWGLQELALLPTGPLPTRRAQEAEESGVVGKEAGSLGLCPRAVSLPAAQAEQAGLQGAAPTGMGCGLLRHA